jgi:ABC-type Fe3+/spermidine/putrescine transport system ATPase subunit
MSYLSVRHLIKTFGDFKALDDVSIEMERGKVCALLGPSGCGKTTTLRCIAGLETADSGHISLDGRVLSDPSSGDFIAPEKRELGMVFQSYALWPHKSVAENISLGLKIQGLPQGEIRDRVASGLELVGMAGTQDRFPANLSGGQQQRVALARALTLRPKCILFDEPLSNLDLLLRERMRFEIRELLVKLGITAVYVTHDQTEALVISDHIVVMNRGNIEQEGPPMEVYARPRNRFTAEFLGRTNVLPLNRKASDPSVGIAVAEGGTRFMSRDGARLSEEGAALIAFRPEMVRINEQATDNIFDTTVSNCQFLGSNTQLVLDLGGVPVTALLPGSQNYRAGDAVRMSIDPAHVLVLQD